MVLRITLALAAAALVPSQIAAQQGASEDGTTDMLKRMAAGRSQMEGAELDAAIGKAASFPLGSKENPVRAAGPSGQRAYLSRLRCADLKRPSFRRVGSMGISPYGNIVDGYSVTCEGSEPAERLIYLDMYHAGYAEDRAVEGYGATGGQSEGTRRAPEGDSR